MVDFKQAKKVLDRLAAKPSYPSRGPGFPQGGKVYTDGLSQSNVKGKIRNDGFDVTVVIVPGNDSSNSAGKSYFNYHNKGWTGVFVSHDRAVAATGGVGPPPASKKTDNWTSTIGAQEIGHYFQRNYKNPTPTHPWAQRDDDNGTNVSRLATPVDFAHARDQQSDHDGDGTVDPPGVVSTGYDLETGGFDNVQSHKLVNGTFKPSGPKKNTSYIFQLPSYMSYAGNNKKLWTDARIHQQLIDGDWSYPNGSGSPSSGPVLQATGTVTDDGSIEYVSVTAYEGLQRYNEAEDGEVTVSLVGPDGGSSRRPGCRTPLITATAASGRGSSRSSCRSRSAQCRSGPTTRRARPR